MNLLFITLFVIISAYIDYEHLKDNDYIEDHRSRFILRLLFCFAVGYPDIYQVVGMGMFFSATFDNTLNLMRGKPLLHLGNTALWDKFWRDKMLLYIIFIVIYFFLSIFIIIKPILTQYS